MEDELLFKLRKEFDQVIGLPELENIKEHRIDLALDPKNLIDVANFLKHEMGFTIPNMCTCLLYTSPSPRDGLLSRMPSSA